MNSIVRSADNLAGDPIEFGPQWEQMKKDGGFQGRVEMQLPPCGIGRGQFTYPAGTYCVESSEHWGVGIVRHPFELDHCAFGTTKSTQRRIHASELIVSEPDAGFEAKLRSGTTVEYILISKTRFAQALPESHRAFHRLPGCGDTYFSSPLLLHLVHALLDHLQKSQNAFDYYTDALADAIVAELTRDTASALPGERLNTDLLNKEDLARVQTYIFDNLHTKISLEKLAGMVNQNTSTLRKGFKSRTGKTLYQFVLDARVEKARTILTTTRTSLAKVAFDCGFSSQSHMTDVFRQKLGTTPGKIRNC